MLSSILSPVEDARLLWSFLERLNKTKSHVSLQDICIQISLVTKTYPNLEYTNLENILNLLIVNTFPYSTSSTELAEIVRVICYPQDTESIDQSMLETIIMSSYRDVEVPEAVVLNTISEIIIDSKLKGFVSIEEDELTQSVIYKFVQAKVSYSARYRGSIESLEPLLELVSNYPPFESWYNGLVKPFIFYWNNFGVTASNPIKFEQLQKASKSERFAVLIEPMNSSNERVKLGLKKWFINVIFPLIEYHNNDFSDLIRWLFVDLSVENRASNYEIWDKVIGTIIQSSKFVFEEYDSIIRYFIAAVYYHAPIEALTLSSVETTKVYDTIVQTLSYISTKKERIDLSEKIEQFPKYESLVDFVEDTSNPFSALISPTGGSIASLRQMVETCQKLYPINKLTIARYLELKYYRLESNEARREIIKITSGITRSNSTTLLASIQLFKEQFTHSSQLEDINKLIIERVLSLGLFEIVADLNKTFELKEDDMARIVLDKFWESFDRANSFDDKKGDLSDCRQCMEFIENLNDISKENKREIVAIKHLFKAFSILKNFKIYLRFNEPLTPSKLLVKFCPEEDNSPLSLITLVLELNPKSYLAFEKLYKILNDLILFFDNHTNYKATSKSIDLDDKSLFNKLKAACIESALVDNNFPYAYKQSKQLFEYTDKLDSLWLTFYQVGKYISSDEEESVDLLLKQREILSLTLETLSLSTNTKAILRQWQVINDKIELHYTESNVQEVTEFNDITMSSEIKENIGAIANDILNEATATTNHASEKLSSLLVSGLGWAIGANQH